MTSDDIKKVQIIAELHDGNHIIAFSADKLLIKVIVSYCKFSRLKEELFGTCSLKDLIE